jgi:uncharacterized membrane protein
VQEDGYKFPPNRLEALTDGIFAIVMTILVLDIKTPNDMNLLKVVNVRQFLYGHFQDVLVYMIVFIALAYIWFINHIHMHHIKHTDRNHLWINMILLMFVGLVPFSSSLVNKFPGDLLADTILGANMFAIGLMTYANWAYATKHKRLVDEDLSPSYVKSEKRRLLLFPIVVSVSMVIALVYPHISYYVLLAAPLLLFAQRFFRRPNKNNT